MRGTPAPPGSAVARATASPAREAVRGAGAAPECGPPSPMCGGPRPMRIRREKFAARPADVPRTHRERRTMTTFQIEQTPTGPAWPPGPAQVRPVQRPVRLAHVEPRRPPADHGGDGARGGQPRRLRPGGAAAGRVPRRAAGLPGDQHHQRPRSRRRRPGDLRAARDPALAGLPAVIGGKLGVQVDANAGLETELLALGYDAVFTSVRRPGQAIESFREFVAANVRTLR